MRRLIEDAGLPEPDEVRYQQSPRELILLWHDRRVVVVVELDDERM